MSIKKLLRPFNFSIFHKIIRRIQLELSANVPSDSTIAFTPHGIDRLESILTHLNTAYGHLIRSDDIPVFLLAAGWRSGSTLLQRLLMSQGDILLWGEPYSDTRIIQHMARQFRCFRNNYPFEKTLFPWKDNFKSASFDMEWIAYLFPHPQCLYDAHLAFYDTLLKESAIKAGFTNWGIKDVRLDGSHAMYLNWIYPRAKFIFLIRNPWDAWKSYVGKNWHLEWPDIEIRTAKQFTQLWKHLTGSFIDVAPKLSSLVIRYEDFQDNPHNAISMLENFTGISINRKIMNVKISGFDKDYSKYSIHTMRRFLSDCGEPAKYFNYSN